MAASEHSDGVDAENNECATAATGLFCLEILQIIKEAQQQHGLRHGDYQRYRQYCSRRLRRIRKSLHFPQGTKNKVQPKTITTQEVLRDGRYLYLPLFLAERAWAYAMQLKNEANTEPRKQPHMIARLKKAQSHAAVLMTLCESNRCDARTKLEAQAYAAFIKACLAFEKENWKTAIELYTSAKTIYEKLASALVDEIKDIYRQKCDEISPNIRYCAYNIGDDSAIQDLLQMRMKGGGTDSMISRLDELIEKTRERQAATLSEVTWRGRTVPVKSERVRVCLLTVQESTKQLAETTDIESKLSVYETLLKELIDAQQALREDFKDDPTFKHQIRGKLSDSNVPNSVYLHSYLTYMRLTNTIDRNLLMIEMMKNNLPGKKPNPNKKITKPQDLARLYDIIVQNLNEISSLPGLEDDLTLVQELSAQMAGYKAFRCYYIAHTYLAAKKWREALALYERVSSYVDLSLQSYASVKMDPAKKQEQCDNLEKLKRDVDGEKYSCHASSLLDVEGATDLMSGLTVKSNEILENRLDQYYEDPQLLNSKKQLNIKLTKFPPSFQPVPCKPLFFDVALSKVEFPSLDDKLDQKQQQQGGGLTGLVKGWLWGGGKK